MTVKDLRIKYCQSAINCPFTELFQLDIEGNEDDIELYIIYLEEELIKEKEVHRKLLKD